MGWFHVPEFPGFYSTLSVPFSTNVVVRERCCKVLTSQVVSKS